MAFGRFFATLKPAKKQPEPVEFPRPLPPPAHKEPLKPPVDPFVEVKEPEEQSAEKEPDNAYVVEPSDFDFDLSEVDSMQVHIAVFGRNLSIIREFLSGMERNMADALQEEGLSYFSREMSNLTEVSSQRQRIELFCSSFSKDNWIYSPDEQPQKDYLFTISPAGRQQNPLDLHLHCATPAAGLRPQQMDAVWLVTDGCLYQEGLDTFTGFLQSCLTQLSENGASPVPVCVIMSQIESIGHYQEHGLRRELPAVAAQRLIQAARDVFAPHCGDANAALIPVQVYGGLECVDRDGAGMPVLRLGESNYYRSYKPAFCEAPAIYTVTQLAKMRSINYFDDTVSGGFLGVAKAHWRKVVGDANWSPALLKEES